MINLEDEIGLDIQMMDNFRLQFGADVEYEQFTVRKFSDLAVVTAEENLDLNDESAYLMYRNVRKKGDLEKIKKANLRFDLTVIPPAKLGTECIKTSGHYHPRKIGSNVAYPELYYVLSGQATYLNQKQSDSGIEDVILSRVKNREAIVTPPDYGHVTINELNQPIVMANWVCDDFESLYGDYEEKRGACYYLFEDGKLVANNLYGNLPEIRILKPNQKIFTQINAGGIYNSDNLEKFRFLTNPEDYLSMLNLDNLFAPQ